MSTFESHRRSAPKVPDETCPAIDEAISAIDSAAKELSDLTDRRGAMEALRRANADLRELAAYWRSAAEELAAEVDRMERENETLKDGIADLSRSVAA